MTRPRAVIADDSHFMRSVIGDILESGGVHVVGEARDGREAVDLVAETEPDVVTMDVEMPVMDGIEAVERIMAETPTPIVMLSAHTDENAEVTFEALESGAVDFVTKPGGEVSIEMSRLEDTLVELVTSIAEAGGVDPDVNTTPVEPSVPDWGYADRPTLVVGSSTGGPTVVERVLGELPIDADFRILIVQHMPAGFTERFARRIDARTDYDVREASHGDRIGGGEALVAPGDAHMRVADYADGRIEVALSEDPPVNSVRRAVDETMTTAAEMIDDPLVGVVLTGMGGDGAAGIGTVKSAGGRTIAEELGPLSTYRPYVERDGDTFTVRETVREMVTFGRHDLISGDPKRDFDLVLCRNLLIYIDASYKEPIFETIRASLRDGGYLMIGTTETLPAGSRELFEPVSKNHRIYRRT